MCVGIRVVSEEGAVEEEEPYDGTYSYFLQLSLVLCKFPPFFSSVGSANFYTITES